MIRHVSLSLALAVAITANAGQMAPAAVKMTALNFSVSPAIEGQTTTPSFQLREPAPMGTLAFRDTFSAPIRTSNLIDRYVPGDLSSSSGAIHASWDRFDSAIETKIDSLAEFSKSEIAQSNISQTENFILGPHSTLTVTALISYYLPENIQDMNFSLAPKQDQVLQDLDHVTLNSHIEAILSIKQSTTAVEQAVFHPDNNTSVELAVSKDVKKDVLNGIVETEGYFYSEGDYSANTVSEGIYNRSTTLTVSYTNNSELPFNGDFNHMMGSISSYTSILSVPEPSTWAFMGLGLVGVAAAANRRRQTTRQTA